jgi:hypothetical protein
MEYDDEGSEDKARKGFAALSDREAAIVIGPVESHTAGAVLAVAAELGLPFISPSATASILTEPYNPWFFRATPSDYQKVEMLSRLVGLRHPHGALLVFHESRDNKLSRRSDLLCGESTALDIKRVFATAGHICTLLPFNRDLDQKALTDRVTSLMSQRSFVGVVIVGRSSDTLRVTRIVRSLHESCPVYLISPGKEMFSRTRFDNVFAITDTVVETVSDVALDRFRTEYVSEFPGSAKQEAIDQYATFGYDTAEIVCAAIRRLAEGGNHLQPIGELRASLRQAISATPTDRIGLMSEGGFTSRGELIARPHVQHLVGGKWNQLAFDEAVVYVGTERLRAVRRLLRQAQYRLDSTERHPLVRLVNVIGYVATGVISIWAILKLL